MPTHLANSLRYHRSLANGSYAHAILASRNRWRMVSGLLAGVIVAMAWGLLL